VVVRPEAVRLGAGDNAEVVSVERRGAVTYVTVRTAEGRELEAATTTLDPPCPGDRVAVELDPDGVVDVAADPSRNERE
jgi:hypothetical protein